MPGYQGLFSSSPPPPHITIFTISPPPPCPNVTYLDSRRPITDNNGDIPNVESVPTSLVIHVLTYRAQRTGSIGGALYEPQCQDGVYQLTLTTEPVFSMDWSLYQLTQISHSYYTILHAWVIAASCLGPTEIKLNIPKHGSKSSNNNKHDIRPTFGRGYQSVGICLLALSDSKQLRLLFIESYNIMILLSYIKNPWMIAAVSFNGLRLLALLLKC